MYVKPITPRDEGYKAFVRTLPCIICGDVPPNDPHHLKPEGRNHGGMGIKCSDYRCIPLCRMHHNEIESKGKKYVEEKYSVDLTEQNIVVLEKYIQTREERNGV